MKGNLISLFVGCAFSVIFMSLLGAPVSIAVFSGLAAFALVGFFIVLLRRKSNK